MIRWQRWYFASPTGVDFNFVHGKPVVKEGQLIGLDLTCTH